MRILLSPPDVGPLERQALLDAFDSGWVAPMGPQLDAFEVAVAHACGTEEAAALASGTAALHLALRLVGVKSGDEVLVPSFTFAATANAVAYLGARPTFVDSELMTWNISPDLVLEVLADRRRHNCLPAAVVTVDLYGQAADHGPIIAACRELDIPVVEDAAEALGATAGGRPAGSLGDVGVVSFNGNKLITTSGGGALVGSAAHAKQARWLATQAREPLPHYEHETIGYNYRLSNLLAGLGLAQLSRLDELVAARRAVHERYRAALADRPGVGFQPRPAWSNPNNWLTVIQLDPVQCGVEREQARLALATRGIEARPAWKPLHLQKAFAGADLIGSGKICESLFTHGLCLPSGSTLTLNEQGEVIAVLEQLLDAGRPR